MPTDWAFQKSLLYRKWWMESSSSWRWAHDVHVDCSYIHTCTCWLYVAIVCIMYIYVELLQSGGWNETTLYKYVFRMALIMFGGVGTYSCLLKELLLIIFHCTVWCLYIDGKEAGGWRIHRWPHSQVNLQGHTQDPLANCSLTVALSDTYITVYTEQQRDIYYTQFQPWYVSTNRLC